MIRSAVAPEAAHTQVFVDSTGRRKRILAVAGFLVALFSALYVGVIGASVVEATDVGLTTRATVSTAPTASAGG